MISSIPAAIVQGVEQLLGGEISGFSFAVGGCINKGGKLTTGKGDYFLKWNDARKFPGMFEAEAKGLSILRESHSVRVPDVVHVGRADTFQFLMLEYIDEGQKSSGYWRDLGSELAAMHRQSSTAFGLDHDNYIGSLVQRNKSTSGWVEFFIECRLRPQLQTGRDRNRIEASVAKKFESLFGKLPSMLPEEPPALVHGDLWGGNLMTDAVGQPCLIDPAVYYGNREADLAMTRLFGGFNPSFLESYNDRLPLIAGFRERFDIYNLYPLLVHVNLFDGGYVSQVVSILDQLV